MLAEPFATTPAGYITGIVVPALLTGIVFALGYGFRRFSARMDRQDNALASTTLALAVLTAEVAPTREQTSRNTVSIGSLDRMVAVLDKSLEDHQRWHDRQ